MTQPERRYVLILDKRLDYIRLFRADCPLRPEGKALWEGDGLKRAYEAMKSLNRRRKPVLCYFVCSSQKSSKFKKFRCFKSTHPKQWISVSTHTAYREAVEAAKRLREAERSRQDNLKAARKEKRHSDRLEKEAMLGRLRRVGVITKKVPKLTEKDRRYLEWIETRDAESEDAA